jgi:hypothetical protein
VGRKGGRVVVVGKGRNEMWDVCEYGSCCDRGGGVYKSQIVEVPVPPSRPTPCMHVISPPLPFHAQLITHRRLLAVRVPRARAKVCPVPFFHARSAIVLSFVLLVSSHFRAHAVLTSLCPSAFYCLSNCRLISVLAPFLPFEQPAFPLSSPSPLSSTLSLPPPPAAHSCRRCWRG